jgi:hypothetical protein
VAGRKPDLRLGGAIGAQLVRHDHIWRVTLLRQETARKRWADPGRQQARLGETLQQLAPIRLKDASRDNAAGCQTAQLDDGRASASGSEDNLHRALTHFYLKDAEP